MKAYKEDVMISPYLLAGGASLLSIGVTLAFVAISNIALRGSHPYLVFALVSASLFYLLCLVLNIKMTLPQKLITPILYLGVGPWCSAVVLGALY